MAASISSRRETRRDVLRAVPIEGVQPQREAALGQPSISGRGEPLREVGFGLEVVRGDCHVNLAPAERESKGSALVQAAVAARQF